MANFWINISGKGASNSPHVHSGNNYSGVFFIKIPKEMSGGRFLFYRNFNDAALNSTAYMGQFKDGYKMQSYDYPIITIPPKENMLLVFPSWVPHAVETNLSDEDRISLSFNFILNRSLPWQFLFNVETSSLSNQIYVFNDNTVVFNNKSYLVNNDALKNALLNELIVEDTIILSIEGDVTHKITIELMDFLQQNSFSDVQIRTLSKWNKIH